MSDRVGQLGKAAKVSYQSRSLDHPGRWAKPRSLGKTVGARQIKTGASYKVELTPAVFVARARFLVICTRG